MSSSQWPCPRSPEAGGEPMNQANRGRREYLETLEAEMFRELGM